MHLDDLCVTLKRVNRRIVSMLFVPEAIREYRLWDDAILISDHEGTLPLLPCLGGVIVWSKGVRPSEAVADAITLGCCRGRSPPTYNAMSLYEPKHTPFQSSINKGPIVRAREWGDDIALEIVVRDPARGNLHVIRKTNIKAVTLQHDHQHRVSFNTECQDEPVHVELSEGIRFLGTVDTVYVTCVSFRLRREDVTLPPHMTSIDANDLAGYFKCSREEMMQVVKSGCQSGILGITSEERVYLV
jgi:hypothetical protein